MSQYGHSPTTINITYRGSLASCNYGCDYCPFAKQHDDKTARLADQKSLKQFTQWLSEQHRPLKLFFTPWGEALVRRWYRDAIVEISHMPQVQKIVVQTNLSVPPEWLELANKQKIALWATYHPSEITLDKFVEQSNQLCEMSVAHSVGIVGTKENITEANNLKAALDPSIYLWVNAYKDEQNYYSSTDIEQFKTIDPLFNLNLTGYESAGQACNAGENALSIDHQGTAYPCHFVGSPLGNIYQQTLEQLLAPYNCPNTTCECYIGYSQLKSFHAEQYYGDKVLERIPLMNI